MSTANKATRNAMYNACNQIAVDFYSKCRTCERKHLPIEPRFARDGHRGRNRLDNFIDYIVSTFNIPKTRLSSYTFKLRDEAGGLVHGNIEPVQMHVAAYGDPKRAQTRVSAATDEIDIECIKETDSVFMGKAEADVKTRAHVQDNSKSGIRTQVAAERLGEYIFGTIDAQTIAHFFMLGFAIQSPATEMDARAAETMANLGKLKLMLSPDEAVAKAAIIDSATCVCNSCNLCKYRNKPIS